MTGLVVGSIAPDFEYFMRLNGDSYYSHSWLGILYFNLPLSILLAFLFHVIVRNIMIDNLPGFLARRFVAFKDLDWPMHFKNNFWVVIISMMVGAASHLITDDFTHAHTAAVDMLGILRKHIHIGGKHLPVYIFLQYLGTVIGGLIIIYAVFQLPAAKHYINNRPILPFWICVSAIMVMVVMLKYYFGHFPRKFDDRIVILVSGWLCGLLVTSFFQKYVFTKRGLPAV